MRINQFGAYREVQRLVQLPAETSKEPRQFSALLSALSPDAQSKQVVTQPVLPQPAFVSKAPSDTRASIRLPAPELRSTSSKLMAPMHEPAPSAKDQSPSVKVPTVVSATRVSIPDPFSGMNRDQKEMAVQQLVRLAGSRHGIDPALSMAVVSAESSFDPKALSSDGHLSKGLMQLLDSTGKEELAQLSGAKEYEPYHPHLNVDLGVRYLRRLHDMFSAPTVITSTLTTAPAANSSSLEKLAVAAFNAGQGRVASAQQRAQRDGKNPTEFADVEAYLPQSTQEYVRRVMSKRDDFEPRFSGEG
jgi:soluble lytic murein transglycosylase-like protein